METAAADNGKRGFVIGLTGSSGSGKSEAAKVLAGLGASVVDADAVARAVTEERAVLDELAEALGGWIIDGEGKFNRAYVSERAFSDAGVLARLTEITHKYIVKEIRRRVDELKKNRARIIVVDAPIPVKNGFLDISDVVWVVQSQRRRRLERIIDRDGVSAEAAEARFSSQLPDEEYERLADLVIVNDGSREALKTALIRHMDELKERV